LNYQTREDSAPLYEDLLRFGPREFIEPPDMTYGWAKMTGEYLAKFAHEQYGLDVRVYRPFGGYGEDQDLKYPVPAIVKRIINKENPVIIWGSGEQQRDFIWIDDIVHAVEKTMDVEELSGKPLNLGTGRATSFFDLARMVCDMRGHDAVIKSDPDKPEGVFSRVADTTELNKYYTPLITLEEGLKVMEVAMKGTPVSAMSRGR
jgi:nucleoside-diphosphate-sugar epimerase